MVHSKTVLFGMLAAVSFEALAVLPPGYDFTRQRLFPGFDGTYCKVQPAVASDGKGTALLTYQDLRLSGCDEFYGQDISLSKDGGRTWSLPKKVENLPDAWDGDEYRTTYYANPFYHRTSGRFFGLGAGNVFEEKGRTGMSFTGNWAPGHKPVEFPICVKIDAERGQYVGWEALEFPHAYYRCMQFGQVVELDNGDMIVPFYYTPADATNLFQGVCITVKYRFAGDRLKIVESGEPVSAPQLARGVGEPSLVRLGDTYYLTLRSDEQGLFATSRDGLRFSSPQPWKWDDGTLLANRNTQQHWLKVDGELHLAYTREDAANGHVFRNRAPVWSAKFDPKRGCLVKATEFPLVPELGARLGNFCCCPDGADGSWLVTAEWMQPIGCEKYGSDNSLWLVRAKPHEKITIAVPDGSTAKFVAKTEEIGAILEKTYAKPVRVVKERAAKGKATVWLGDTAKAREAGFTQESFGREEHAAKSTADEVVVAGSGETGALFGLCEFLERLGYRYYDDRNEFFPDLRGRKFPELAFRRKPGFDYRQVFTGLGKIKWGSSGPGYGGLFLKQSNCGFPHKTFGAPGNTHTFAAYCADWPKDEPELLAMTPDGKRRPITGRIGPNFCLTNPKARERMRLKLRQYVESDRADAKRRRTPPPFLYCIMQNDCSDYFCRCPDCRRITEVGGESALNLDLINFLARDIAKDYPDIYIWTSAYAYSEEPPKNGVRAEPNVIIQLCRTQANMHSPARDDASSPFPGYLRDWQKHADNIALWTYWIFFWESYPMPYHNIDLIPGDIRWFRDMGVRFYLTESEDMLNANFFTFKRYLGLKLMDDPDRDVEALTEDFFRNFYGLAAADMRAIVDFIAETQKGRNVQIFGPGTHNRTAEQRPWQDAAFYEKLESMFDRAESRFFGPCRQLTNVRRERYPVDLGLLNLYGKLKPAISRERLVERYRSYAKEFLRAYVDEKDWATELAKVDVIADGQLKGEEIERTKSLPLPEIRIPRAPDEVTTRDFYDNRGFRPEGRKVTMSASLLEGNRLRVRFSDNGYRAKDPVDDPSIWKGDDWELFLSDGGDGYVQILVSPSGKFKLYHSRKEGFDTFELNGFEAKSAYEAPVWRTELVIPLDELPIKGVSRANFFHANKPRIFAWSPTFSVDIREPARFGKVSFER